MPDSSRPQQDEALTVRPQDQNATVVEDEGVPVSIRFDSIPPPETERTNVMLHPPAGMITPREVRRGHAGSLVDDGPESHCGRYKLCFELAAGGMANVFLARQDGPAGFDRFVALKRVHKWLLDEEEFIEMFLDEARIASGISHPNVCSVVDFGESQGTFFLAMEYMLGEPLSAVRKLTAEHQDILTGSLPHAVRIVADACEGLHAAHETRDDEDNLLGVVHRDVCPQNLFVTYDGNTKVVDFGIAKAAGRIHKTATGIVKGHISYMAPEQLSGAPVDRRADVWALGVVLWELIAGERLFSHQTAVQTIRAIMNGPVPRLSRVRRGIPEAIDSIVAKALSREPEARYPTARELGRALTHFSCRHLEPTGLAEVAEWMNALFAEERHRKIAMLRHAKRM
jgi:serine/threonine-protein kinase